jgi:hypothetical protein
VCFVRLDSNSLYDFPARIECTFHDGKLETDDDVGVVEGCFERESFDLVMFANLILLDGVGKLTVIVLLQIL